MSEESHQELYQKRLVEISDHKAKLDQEISNAGKLKQRIIELKAELEQTESNLRLSSFKLNQLKLPISTKSKLERAVQIPWPKFLEYVAENKAAWIYEGIILQKNWRFFCKAPRCTNGRYGKLDDYDTIDAYYLYTLSHGEWRLCNACIDYYDDRKGAVTHRSKGSTRPLIDNDTLITIDPYIYDDIRVVKNLLKLGGVTVE